MLLSYKSSPDLPDTAIIKVKCADVKHRRIFLVQKISDLLSQQLLADDEPLNLACALVNLEDFCVTHQFLNWIFA